MIDQPKNRHPAHSYFLWLFFSDTTHKGQFRVKVFGILK